MSNTCWRKNTYFFDGRFRFIRNAYIVGLDCSQSANIKEGTLLNTTEDSLDSHDYDLFKCDEDAFTTIILEQCHSYYNTDDNDDEDEDFEEMALEDMQCCNGTIEIIRLFNQNCVVFWKF